MFGLGFSELLLIAIVILVFIGPDRLPEFMKVAGRIYGQVRRAGDELRTALTAEADRAEAQERYQKMLERRRQAEEARRKAAEIGAVPQDATKKPDADPTPLQLLPADQDPEAPMIRRDPLAVPPEPRAAAEPASEPPPGVSAAEWASLPPHIREMLRKTA